MSATYNWSIKGGSVINGPSGNAIIDKGAIIAVTSSMTVAASTDDVAPTNTAYVALFGNDATGNGSRLYPFKTISKGISTNKDLIVVGSGTYREQITGSGGYIRYISDGDVTLDGTIWTSLILNANGFFFNFKIVNSGINNGQSDTRFQGCRLSDCIFGSSPLIMNNCIVERAITHLPLQNGYPGISMSTFVDCYDISFNEPASTKYINWCNVFKNCNLWFPSQSYMSSTVFFNCNAIFGSSRPQAPNAPYTTLPTGYTEITALSDLQALHLAAFPGSSLFNFASCVFGDPLFNGEGIGDYSLQQASPAKTLSYYGTYIGAIGIGLPIIARATESAGSFDFSTNVNLSVEDDSITFTDDTMDAQIDTVPLWNQLTRIINQVPLFGFNADRNGQYVDTIPDLGSIVGTTGTLAYPSSWIVQAAAIVYNGFTYQPGDRFTTVSGQSTFTSTSGGQVQEITEAPERHTVMARFSDGGAAVADTDALTVGSWYFVTAGSVNYDDGTVIHSMLAGAYFKALNTGSWVDEGGGAVELAFPDEATLAFQHYDPAFQPTTNNAGDVRTGAVLRGNGDPDYVRGTGHEWPVNSKHMQFRYMLKHNNLTP